ncbi:MAG: helix-turn-helix domain-containing protein [Polyangiaceae bacterium]
MRLSTLTPHPAIAPFIHHFWVFESAVGLPSGDARVVVPNGRHKLIVPYRNGLTASPFDNGTARAQHHAAGDAVLVGLWEEPTIISSSEVETVTIGIEFHPHGLSRFFPVVASELTQRIESMEAVLGNAGRALGQRVGGARSIDEAVDIVRDFLLDRFVKSAETPELVRISLQLLASSQYRMDVAELERKMGYSRRYLHALFAEHVGLSPKRLMGVLQFEQLYRKFSQNKSVEQLKRDALQLFYDQSHFIRNFRRFTGYAPGRFAELDNEFGRIFYVATTPSHAAPGESSRERLPPDAR